MISYEPLWKTMAEKGATTYTLRNKGVYSLSGSTMERLKSNLSVSTNTLDTICKILDCKIQDIIEFLPDTESDNISKE